MVTLFGRVFQGKGESGEPTAAFPLCPVASNQKVETYLRKIDAYQNDRGHRSAILMDRAMVL